MSVQTLKTAMNFPMGTIASIFCICNKRTEYSVEYNILYYCMTATRAHKRIIKHLITNQHLFRISLITRFEICTAFTFLGISSRRDSPYAAYIQCLDIVPETFFTFFRKGLLLTTKVEIHHHRSITHTSIITIALKQVLLSSTFPFCSAAAFS